MSSNSDDHEEKIRTMPIEQLLFHLENSDPRTFQMTAVVRIFERVVSDIQDIQKKMPLIGGSGGQS